MRDVSSSDHAPWLAGVAPRKKVPVARQSLHLTMRDGVRIAVDVHRPRGQRAPLPAIVRQTRYFRGVAFREPFARLPITWLLDHAADTRDRFVANGYVWVDVCVRGSGASFGSRACPWSPDEIADGYEVVDWMVAQPWCNGRVGATGVSYDGTAAELLLVNRHPAVRAIVPRFSLYDVYTDVAFPGGIHLAWFTEAWSHFNQQLDRNALDAAFAAMLRVQLRAWRAMPHNGLLGRVLAAADRDGSEELFARALRLVARGVRRVDGDDGVLLAAALEDHRRNFDVHQGALRVQCRDDAGVSSDYPDATVDFFSPHAHAAALSASGAAIYGYSGWLDAAYQHGAIKRFAAVPNPGSRLILGPWDHGGLHDVSPFSTPKSAFDHDAEMIRFFDHHLRGAPLDDPPVRYFTIGEEKWKTAEHWPPPSEPQRWYLSDERRLSPTLPAAGCDAYQVDADVGTGRRSRWDSLLGILPPVGYSGRAALGRRMLVYRSDPLPAPLEVTGHPVVALEVGASTSDAHLFVYLEDEAPDGEVYYVTEGQLRAAHRRVSERPPPYPVAGPYHSFLRADLAPLGHGEVAQIAFDLLPISWRFARGHRLRLAVAGADRDHFAALPEAPALAIHRGGARPSSITLPVVASPA